MPQTPTHECALYMYLQAMQAEADSAAQIITELRAELAAMAIDADAMKLQLNTLTSEASALRKNADSAQADAQQLRQQLATSHIQADLAAQTRVSLTAELKAMADRADAAEQLQAATQVSGLPPALICPPAWVCSQIYR